MTHVADLPVRWRTESATLRRRGAVHQAIVLEGCADDLEQELHSVADQLLTVDEAAIESGYSEESLRRMVRDGRLPCERQAGKTSRILLRRADLPQKPRQREGGKHGPNIAYDPVEDARDIAKRYAR